MRIVRVIKLDDRDGYIIHGDYRYLIEGKLFLEHSSLSISYILEEDQIQAERILYEAALYILRTSDLILEEIEL